MSTEAQITADIVRQYSDLGSKIEAFIGPLGRAVHMARQKVKGVAPETTIIQGYVTRWEVDGDSIEVTYYDSWRYGGQDSQTVTFPLSYLDEDSWRAEFEAQAGAAEEKRAIAAKAASDAKEAAERAKLAELQAKYPS